MTTIEVVVRDYLRAQPGVSSLVNDDPTRINLEWKGDARATRVVVYRTGGGQHPYLPLHQPVLTFSVYGSTRPAAAGLADAIVQALSRITQVNEPLQSCEVVSVSWVPAPEGAARYIVIAQVTAHTEAVA